MPRLTWSAEARNDLRRLYRFIAEKNPGAAQRAIATIRRDVKVLALHPEIGRPVEGFAIEMREWVIEFGQGGYIALYWWDGVEVQIVGVRHGR